MRTKGFIFIFVMILFLFLSSAIFAIKDAKLLRSPDVKRDRIAFVYAGDLWTASIKGGNAARLTTHPGLEGGPVFSPDGKTIAFTAEYDGNTDVFIIPSDKYIILLVLRT